MDKPLMYYSRRLAAALGYEIRLLPYKVRLVLYTPLEETFSFPLNDAIAFTGTGDPWVGKEQSRIPEVCRERGIPCYVYPEANHSLETGDIRVDLDNMKQIMRRTGDFMKRGNGAEDKPVF